MCAPLVAAEKKTLEGTVLASTLKKVIADYEAGIPTDPGVRWIGMQPSKIQRKVQQTGEKISYYLVRAFLKDMGI